MYRRKRRNKGIISRKVLSITKQVQMKGKQQERKKEKHDAHYLSQIEASPGYVQRDQN
jgi:hypothetical protein